MLFLKNKLFTLVAAIGLANFYSIGSWATPHSKEEFCQLTSDPLALKALALDEANRLPFENHGGMGNFGTCWWHSRFQRQALYLTVFRPDLPTPTKSEVAILLRDIVSKKKVVEIPGYSNLSAFARDFAFEIQKALTRWQRIDALLKFSWIDGLKGDTKTTAEKLRAMMDQLFVEVEIKGHLVYQKLHISRALSSHGWVVVKMDKLSDGYKLYVIDSNYPTRTLSYTYREGDTYIDHYFGPTLPYIRKSKDLSQMGQAIKSYCGALFLGNRLLFEDEFSEKEYHKSYSQEIEAGSDDLAI